MSDSLIDVDTFYERFFHTAKYGELGKKWPTSTTLLYRIKVTDLSTEDQMAMMSLNWEEWKRIDNAPRKHAEIELKTKVDEFVEEFRNKNITKCKICIDVFLSYSPCKSCAEKLIDLKKEIEGMSDNTDCHMEIKIANFYIHFDKDNVRALIKMTRHDIHLMVFDELTEWQAFLDDVVRLELDTEHLEATYRERQETEKTTSVILRCINKAASLDVSTQESNISGIAEILDVASGESLLTEMR